MYSGLLLSFVSAWKRFMISALVVWVEVAWVVVVTWVVSVICIAVFWLGVYDGCVLVRFAGIICVCVKTLHDVCSTFQCGVGQPVPPMGLGRHVGPSAIPKKFSANILGTKSHGRNSKEHNYSCLHDYSLYCGAHQRISQFPQETTQQAAQPISRPVTWAVQPPTPTGPQAKQGNHARFPSQTGKP